MIIFSLSVLTLKMVRNRLLGKARSVRCLGTSPMRLIWLLTTVAVSPSGTLYSNYNWKLPFNTCGLREMLEFSDKSPEMFRVCCLELRMINQTDDVLVFDISTRILCCRRH